MTPARVVLVDDTPDVRRVISAMLAHDGRFQVVGEAGNGREGVDLAGRLQPDLVLLDLAMPVMDGLTALPLIREAATGTKVVVLSAFGNDQTVQAAMNGGADSFVIKGGRILETLFPVLEEVLGLDCPDQGTG
ncbi:MAG: response regulator transcription factor [Acidimicrobiales bacterium]